MPSIQNQAIRLTRNALQALFRTARHVPADKRDWSPQGAARSAQNQLAECALTPQFVIGLLDGAAYSEDTRARRRELMAALDTLEKAEAAAQENYAAFYAKLESLPDSVLEETRHIAVYGKDVPVADILFLPFQNLIYHTGQINYIQMLLGDTEMH